MGVGSSITDELSFNLSWNKGDIVMKNNLMVMYGRNPFKEKRSILVLLVLKQ